MRFVGERSYLSISPFGEIELPRFSLIIGLNGSGKSHFLQAIQRGSITSDVSGPRKQGVQIMPGVSLISNGDPPPNGMTNRLQTQPNELFKGTSSNSRVATNPALSLRLNLLSNVIPDLEEALGAPLSKITRAENALHVHPAKLLESARKKGFLVNEEAFRHILSDAEKHAEEVAKKIPQIQSVRAIRRTAKRLGVPMLMLSDDQIMRAGSWGNFSLFETHFVQVMLNYRNEKIVNAYRKAAGGDLSRLALSQSAFLKRWGTPPWDRFSEVLSAFGLPYRVNEPSMAPESSVEFKLIRHDGVSIYFDNLSSGEKILIQFALSAFQVNEEMVNVTVPNLLLLDEVDASLHPQNVHRLLEAIQLGFVESMSVPVIMTTHSPTTVALAPDGIMFEMTENDRVPRPITKQQALNRLTTGLPHVSIDYSGRRQAFVESSVDARQYDKLSNILKADLDLPVTITFVSAGDRKAGDTKGGSGLVKRVVRSLSSNGVKSLFGIIDWDKTNEPDTVIKVLGYNKFYTKENVILDPLLVSILLLLDKPNGVSFPIGISEISSAKPEKLQELAKVVLDRVEFGGDLVSNRYLSGLVIKLPSEYNLHNGHDLERRLTVAFPSLQRYSGNGKWLSDQIIGRVIYDFPGLCPQPFVDLFREIASVH